MHDKRNPANYTCVTNTNNLEDSIDIIIINQLKENTRTNPLEREQQHDFTAGKAQTQTYWKHWMYGLRRSRMEYLLML